MFTYLSSPLSVLDLAALTCNEMIFKVRLQFLCFTWHLPRHLPNWQKSLNKSILLPAVAVLSLSECKILVSNTATNFPLYPSSSWSKIQLIRMDKFEENLNFKLKEMKICVWQAITFQSMIPVNLELVNQLWLPNIFIYNLKTFKVIFGVWNQFKKILTVDTNNIHLRPAELSEIACQNYFVNTKILFHALNKIFLFRKYKIYANRFIRPFLFWVPKEYTYCRKIQSWIILEYFKTALICRWWRCCLNTRGCGSPEIRRSCTLRPPTSTSSVPWDSITSLSIPR